MLKKTRRIRRSEFSYILSNSKRINTPHLLLCVAQGLNSIESKFSFSVSKKVSKSAVVRNKLRRRGYSIIGKNIDKISNGYFFFFNFKKGSDRLNFEGIENEIGVLLSDFLVVK